jgi:signal transduction histidine kinase
MKEPSGGDHSLNSSTRNLRIRYIIGLSTIALLTVLAQLLIQVQIRNQESDANVVNIAGRQRMLSQRLSKEALLVQANPDEAAGRTAMAATLTLWEQSHIGLQEGNIELNLPGNNSPVVEELYTEISPNFSMMQASAICLIETANTACTETMDTYVQTILANEGPFLEGMNSIVFQYADESEGRLRRLQIIEVALVIVTLAVLALEAVLIFRPAEVQIKQIVTELIDARDKAQAADRLKSRFLANMSHELRTPLNSIINFTELVSLGTVGPVNQEQRSHLDNSVESAEHLLEMINDIMDASKIEAGEMDLFMEQVQVSDQLQSAVRMARSLIADKDVVLHEEIPDDLTTITADKRRIKQIFINILSNAAKFTEKGNITVTAEQRGSDILVLIADSGIGIDPTENERVFERFQQTSTGQEAKGTGLGMPIARYFAKAHGGDIWFESQRGLGTTFFVRLPIQNTPEIVTTPVGA